MKTVPNPFAPARPTLAARPPLLAPRLAPAPRLLFARRLPHPRSSLLALGAFLALGCSPVVAQRTAADPSTDQRFDGVRATIARVMAERSLASVSVAVARGGEVLWEEGFGWANRAERVPATAHTLYSLASISKPISATASMILAERGAVDIDRPVDDYLAGARLSGLGGDAAAATVRRVMAHTAGLPLHYQFFYEGGGYAPPPRAETIRRYAVVAHPPGTEFLYSNLGYGIVDEVIAQASGRPYEDFMRSEVFLPLGLTHTAVGLPEALAPHAAVRYGPENRPVPFYDFDHAGASAVWSSAHDLVRFGLFHLGHVPEGGRRILPEETVQAMHVRETPQGGAGYGLGWFVEDEVGFRKVWHTGSMPGVSTMLALYPELDIAVVVLLNNLARDLRVSLSQEIVAAVDDGYARALEAERSSAAGAGGGGDGGGGSGAFRPPSGLVGAWAGTLRTWQEEVPMRITVGPDGDVHVSVEGQLETALNGAGFANGRLQGRYAGRIPTPDVMRWPLHTVALDLRLESDRLYGQASAQTEADPTYYSLASFVDLRRER
jgi:CubicO group peptidase (beta-lactamase class C family)